MRDLLLACVVFGLLPFVLKRPFWGILMMAWLGYMNPHRLAFGFMRDFPVVQVVVIVTLMGMLISKEPKRMVWTRESILLVVFIAWMGVTTTFAIYQDLAINQYIKVIKIQTLTFMTILMLTTPERVKWFVWAVVLSLGFYGFKGGIFTIVNGGSYRVQGPQGTFIGGNNELALALVMTIPLMRFLQLQAKQQLVKHGLTALMLLTAVAAIGTQSRGALLALSMTGFIFWIKTKNKFVSGFLILLAAAFILALMPDAWFERMATIKTYSEDDSALGRINAWWMAWYLALDRITGGGFESFLAPTFAMYAPEPFRVHDSHSIYFQIMGHHGFIGLGMFLSLLAMTWFTCGRVARLTQGDPQRLWAQQLSRMIQVSLVAYMVGGAFLGLGYFDYFYHLVALAVVTYHLGGLPARTLDRVRDTSQQALRGG